MDNFMFPSAKNTNKYPSIEIRGEANELLSWFAAHPELDRRVPPVYQNFVLYHTVEGKDRFEVFTHYSDSFTSLVIRLKINDRTIITAESDYNTYNAETNYVGVQIYASDSCRELYGDDWLKQTALAALLLILAVQSYMLYFKPDIVEQIYTPSAEPKPKSDRKKRRVTAEPIKLRKSKIKRIVLSSTDRPPKEVNYHKLAWHVRGHYRHVGKEKKLKYIQPFVCERGGKKYKPKPQRYIVEK